MRSQHHRRGRNGVGRGRLRPQQQQQQRPHRLRGERSPVEWLGAKRTPSSVEHADGADRQGSVSAGVDAGCRDRISVPRASVSDRCRRSSPARNASRSSAGSASDVSSGRPERSNATRTMVGVCSPAAAGDCARWRRTGDAGLARSLSPQLATRRRALSAADGRHQHASLAPSRRKRGRPPAQPTKVARATEERYAEASCATAARFRTHVSPHGDDAAGAAPCSEVATQTRQTATRSTRPSSNAGGSGVSALRAPSPTPTADCAASARSRRPPQPRRRQRSRGESVLSVEGADGLLPARTDVDARNGTSNSGHSGDSSRLAAFAAGGQPSPAGATDRAPGLPVVANRPSHDAAITVSAAPGQTEKVERAVNHQRGWSLQSAETWQTRRGVITRPLESIGRVEVEEDCDHLDISDDLDVIEAAASIAATSRARATASLASASGGQSGAAPHVRVGSSSKADSAPEETAGSDRLSDVGGSIGVVRQTADARLWTSDERVDSLFDSSDGSSASRSPPLPPPPPPLPVTLLLPAGASQHDSSGPADSRGNLRGLLKRRATNSASPSVRCKKSGKMFQYSANPNVLTRTTPTLTPTTLRSIHDSFLEYNNEVAPPLEHDMAAGFAPPPIAVQQLTCSGLTASLPSGAAQQPASAAMIHSNAYSSKVKQEIVEEDAGWAQPSWATTAGSVQHHSHPASTAQLSPIEVEANCGGASAGGGSGDFLPTMSTHSAYQDSSDDTRIPALTTMAPVRVEGVMLANDPAAEAVVCSPAVGGSVSASPVSEVVPSQAVVSSHASTPLHVMLTTAAVDNDVGGVNGSQRAAGVAAAAPAAAGGSRLISGSGKHAANRGRSARIAAAAGVAGTLGDGSAGSEDAKDAPAAAAGRSTAVDDSGAMGSAGGRGTGHSRRRAGREEGLSAEEEERRRQRRERNKLAAARCRQRRVDQTNELQMKVDALEDTKSQLREEMDKLQQTKKKLETLLQMHTCIQPQHAKINNNDHSHNHNSNSGRHQRSHHHQQQQQQEHQQQHHAQGVHILLHPADQQAPISSASTTCGIDDTIPITCANTSAVVSVVCLPAVSSGNPPGESLSVTCSTSDQSMANTVVGVPAQTNVIIRKDERNMLDARLAEVAAVTPSYARGLSLQLQPRSETQHQTSGMYSFEGSVEGANLPPMVTSVSFSSSCTT